MSVGTYGKIRFIKTARGYQAKARFRGFDGVIRDLTRTGSTKAKAEREIKLAINQEMQTPSVGRYHSEEPISRGSGVVVRMAGTARGGGRAECRNPLQLPEHAAEPRDTCVR